jgi:SSS family solute:Na+ symporter
VFFFGLFWKRINASGALTTVVGGFLIGMGRLVAELNKDRLEGWLFIFADINFLHFAIFLFLACTFLLIAVSLVTAPPSEEQIRGLTYATTVTADRAKSRASWNTTDVVLSLIVVAVVLMVLVYFSPLFMH